MLQSEISFLAENTFFPPFFLVLLYDPVKEFLRGVWRQEMETFNNSVALISQKWNSIREPLQKITSNIVHIL